MLSFITSIFDFNAREVRRIKLLIDKVNALEDEIRNLPDEAFARETLRFKDQLAQAGITLDELLPRAYALVREAARRALGQRHFDAQLIAAVALHEGKIVEQKTGEGKTLTATAALYLNALTGNGVHLVTVNDYLARRDAGWMGAVFHLLGMKTSAIISGASFIYDPTHTDHDAFDPRLAHLRQVEKKEAYLADITYGINSEFGFDYLRDNMAATPEEQVQRGFHFAIVDEADSVLIDEARTPLIISAPYGGDTSKYYDYARIVSQLDPKEDYVIDEKLRSAHMTEKGISHIEQIIKVDNIYEKDFDTLFHIEAALKASTLFRKDKEYIVRNNEILIVDEFTGRILDGRRFSEGIHQAIEAKEGVTIKQESRTFATISLQNYFRGYTKLAGMTGTAVTEAEEFSKIYKTDVLVVPTHRPNIRIDHPDMIYKTERAKFEAVVREIADQVKNGRPVLVGTTSIEKNEYLSSLLHKKGIRHELLNAKNHEREADIIAQAGKKSAVTVATNMAGRGVDIILGGEIQRSRYSTDEAYKKALNSWQQEHDELVKLGGLYVIGTERHESRRIDNQLRGRSGRQGDPGETCFFVSLEDDVMRIFGGEQISKLMTFLKFPEDQPLSHAMVSRAIEQAQVKVEGFNFDQRKHTVEYDDVLNKQREILYSLRNKILLYPDREPEKFRETVLDMMHDEIVTMATSFFAIHEQQDEMKQKFIEEMHVLINVQKKSIEEYLARGETEFIDVMSHAVEQIYDSKEKEVGTPIWHHVVRTTFLSTFEQYWTDHLTAIDDLRDGVRFRVYAQLDPLVEYKNEAFIMFENLLNTIKFESVRRIMHLEVRMDAAEEHLQRLTRPAEQLVFSDATTVGADSKKQTARPTSTGQAQKKIGRNDPCWCGSGKKYKKCHMNKD